MEEEEDVDSVADRERERALCACVLCCVKKLKKNGVCWKFTDYEEGGKSYMRERVERERGISRSAESL